MQAMYDGVNGSPSNKLLNLINSSATSITLDSASNLPTAPNIATIGDSATAEVILYTGKSGSTLTGVTRGFGGTTAQSWAANTPVYRAFTKYDYDAIKTNINTMGDATSTNLLINGGFDIWQRGTSFSAGGYSADRWTLAYNGTGATRAITQQAFTLGQTDVPENPQYYLRYNQSVAGSGGTYNVLKQHVENVRLLSGKSVTLSFYAKAAATTSVCTYANQNFGSGGSADIGVMGATISVGTSWAKYTQTFEIPSVSGKTVGANDYTYFGFAVPNNATFTFDIANVQLNYGVVALPYVTRSFADENRLCKRYYEQFSYIGTAVVYNAAYVRLSSRAYVTKRVVPTVGITSFSAIGNTGTGGTLFYTNALVDSFAPIYNWTSGTVGAGFSVTATVTLDAEL